MWGFPKKRKPKPLPMPPWLKWLIIAFIALGVMQNANRHSPVHHAVQQAENNLRPSKLLHWDSYKNALFPGRTMVRTSDAEPGEGAPAVCGQTAQIRYALAAPAGQKAEQTTLTFHIGDENAPLALEKGVIGMREGGKRSLIAPAAMMDMPGSAKAAPQPGTPDNRQLQAEVTLVKLSPTLPDAQESPFRIAVTHAGKAGAAGAECGEPVQIRLTLWSIDGKKLYPTNEQQSQTLTVMPGKSEYFLGLEQGVLGMARGEQRTLIVPPAYQKTMYGNPPALDFPFPAQQTVLADVEALP